jgi:predicted metal-dependent phosphoesterase TrpH
MKIDLHIHTRHSICSNLDPKEVARYAKAKGIDGLAITDHDSMNAFKKVQETAPNLLIIPGVEITTASGELIALFAREPIKSKLSLRETTGRIHEVGGLVIVPHPFDKYRKSVGDRINEITPDAIEVYNSRNIYKKANTMALDFTKEKGFVAVAGSDAHFKEEIGMAGIITETDNVFDCIRTGRIKLFHKSSSKIVHLKTIINRIARKVFLNMYTTTGSY